MVNFLSIADIAVPLHLKNDDVETPCLSHQDLIHEFILVITLLAISFLRYFGPFENNSLLSIIFDTKREKLFSRRAK